jgi:uncharacterized membrane protein
MNKARMEAFSDGVIAILITIMVFDIKPPAATDLAALNSVAPLLMNYVMSFLYLGIYWNNHHHMLQICHRVSGGVLCANLHLLFWLSLLPFATNWSGSSRFSQLPVAIYGVVLLASAIAYFILQGVLIRAQGVDNRLANAIGSDVKGKASLCIYMGGICLAFWSPLLAFSTYAIVAVLWLIPDRRIESKINSTS